MENLVIVSDILRTDRREKAVFEKNKPNFQKLEWRVLPMRESRLRSEYLAFMDVESLDSCAELTAADRNEARRGLHTLYRALFLFHRNDCRFDPVDAGEKLVFTAAQNELLHQRMQEVIENGRTHIIFRPFEIVVGTRASFPRLPHDAIHEGEPCFFINFFRHDHALVEEVRRLGDACAFSLRQVDTWLYCVEFAVAP